MGALFGKPSSGSSSSYNVNNELLKSSLGGTLGAAGDATSMLKSLFSGDTGGFDAFKNSGGYKAAMQGGTDAIIGNQAAKGMFQSGATGKALTRFGQGLGDSYLQNYIQNLTGYGNLGLGAGGVLASSGQTSNSSQQGGKKGLLGGVLGGIL